MNKLRNIYYEENNNYLLFGDCLELLKDIPDKSIDMVLCDLPYGRTMAKWDTNIDLELLWNIYKRIIKPDGNIILTCIQPFTSILILSNKEMFRYEMIWEKSKATGYADVKYRPMRKHENILCFSYSSPVYLSKIRGKYYPQGLKEINKKRTITKGKNTEIMSKYGNAHENREYIQKYTNYPNSILKFSSEGKCVHPTQKPVALFEYLIKTYTNEDDLVLDNAAGSCTTAVACKNLKRNWICMEKEEKYCEISKKRIENYNKL